MEQEKLLYETHKFQDPDFLPLPGKRRLIVIKNVTDAEGKPIKYPALFFAYSDSHRVRVNLLDIYELIVHKSDYKDRESLIYTPKTKGKDEHISFEDNRIIDEKTMLEICIAFNKVMDSYYENINKPSEYSKEHRLNPVRTWGGANGLKHDMGNLIYDLKTTGLTGMAIGLEEYMKQIDEKIEAMRKLVPASPSYSECW